MSFQRPWTTKRLSPHMATVTLTLITLLMSPALLSAENISVDQKKSRNPATCIATSNSSCIIYQNTNVSRKPSHVSPGQKFEQRGFIRNSDNKDFYKIEHVGGPLEILVTENRTRIYYAFTDDKGNRMVVESNNTILSRQGRPLCIHLTAGSYHAAVWTRGNPTPYRIRIFRRNFCRR